MYYTYEHFDPATGEVVYFGFGCRGRAWACFYKVRDSAHAAWSGVKR